MHYVWEERYFIKFMLQKNQLIPGVQRICILLFQFVSCFVESKIFRPRFFITIDFCEVSSQCHMHWIHKNNSRSTKKGLLLYDFNIFRYV